MSENLVAAKSVNGVAASISEDPNYAVKDGLARMFKVLFHFPLHFVLLSFHFLIFSFLDLFFFLSFFKGGVIMDVVNAEQARIAEEAGACAVMALERVPADIRKDGN